MSLRWKVALAVAAVAAFTTLAAGLASYSSTKDRLYDEIDSSLQVGMMTPDTPGPPQAPHFEMTGPNLGPDAVDPDDPFSRVPDLYQQQVIGPDGNPVFRSGDVALPVTDQARERIGTANDVFIETVTAGGTQFRVRTTGFPGGAFQIARSLEETNRVLSSLRARTLVIVLVATGVAALLGSLIAGRVTASLRRLTAAADTVRTTGQLDVDVATEGRDEVSRLGSSFGAMLSSLARSQTEQRRLVQDAGHELKTPLTSIRTNLDVLRRHPDLADTDRHQVVGDLHAEVEEIVAVAGGVAIDEPRTTFSLGDAVADVVDRYQRRTGRTIRLNADESTVVAQPTGVQRAISNLLENAIKFDPSGGLIEVAVRQGRVEVLDRGPGISDGDAPLVFERFHRGASARTMPGSGLGLSIVRDVVIRNGGTVHAAARDGGGADVGFVLPLAP